MARREKPLILVSPDLSSLTKMMANDFIDSAETAILERGRFAVALSGGSTPRPLYSLLASKEYRGRVDWPKVHLFWGDDRCVPPDSESSNYQLVRKTLLSGIDIPEANVHRMKTELTPAECADDYEKTLRDFFRLTDGEFPKFDFDLLGVGTNGHTASLFPHSTALTVRDRAVVANYVDDPHPWRITFTVPTLNSARRTVFLAGGKDKAEVIREIIFGQQRPSDLPAQLVAPEGTLVWRIDQPAASALPSER